MVECFPPVAAPPRSLELLYGRSVLMSHRPLATPMSRMISQIGTTNAAPKRR